MNQKLVLGIVIALLSLTIYVSALPVGPESIENPYNTTWPTWGALTHEAIAGNVSELNFDGSTITRTYQGYIGNVTGSIVLGDASNNTLYDWTLASPQGEIYAVRSVTVPSWESVTCASQSELQNEDLRLNATELTDEDAVNRTFVVGGAPDQTTRFSGANFSHPQFWTANQSMEAGTCAVATLYNSTSEPSPYFKEVLLSDNVNTDPSTGFVIYTGIISHTFDPSNADLAADGFDDRSYDFEMLVGEDGHGAQTGSTATSSTYWFYLELD
jgi:hypothetical protein